MPFKLIEEVVRTWVFDARQDGAVLRLMADASSDSTDWESGTNLRIECTQCFGSFALPDGAEVEFE